MIRFISIHSFSASGHSDDPGQDFKVPIGNQQEESSDLPPALAALSVRNQHSAQKYVFKFIASSNRFSMLGHSDNPSRDFRQPILNDNHGMLRLPSELIGHIARDSSLTPKDVLNFSQTCKYVRNSLVLEARTAELSAPASHIVNSNDFQSHASRFSKQWIPDENFRVKPLLTAIKSACGHSEQRYSSDEYWRKDGRPIANPSELTEAFENFLTLYDEYIKMDCRSQILGALAEGYSSLTPNTRKTHREKMESEIKKLEPQSLAKVPLASYVKSFRAEKSVINRLNIFKNNLLLIDQFEPLNGANALAELALRRNYLHEKHDDAVRLLYARIHPLLELDRAAWEKVVEDLEYPQPFNRGTTIDLPDDVKNQIAAARADA